MAPLDLSFVVPFKNEEATLAELFSGIEAAVTALDGRRRFEVIFVDDGSDDGGWNVCSALVRARPETVRALRFRRNLGKAAALAAGFEAARGEIVFTLDADLQDDPREIVRFLERLDEGFDIVVGWKKVRHDPWHKVLPSRVFNAMLSRMSRTPLHDHNCGFKCYRAAAAKEVALYGEMHRMIPALSSIRGFTSAEIEVTHHPRRFGRSKYGFSRFARGFMDMLTVAFLQNFRERPLHLLGGLALTAAVGGTLAIVAAILAGPSVLATALAIAGGSLLASAAPLMGLGLLAELLVSMHARQRPPLPVVEELPALTETSVTEPFDQVERRPRTYSMAAPVKQIAG
jgi:dolichol-phosphate mannosyltransferase